MKFTSDNKNDNNIVIGKLEIISSYSFCIYIYLKGSYKFVYKDLIESLNLGILRNIVNEFKNFRPFI